MKFSVAAVVAAAAAVSANKNGTAVTTEVVTAYTTYCPGPTSIVHGNKTYTVTEATTLTITDCPCTITKPIITTSEVVCHDWYVLTLDTPANKKNMPDANSLLTAPSPPSPLPVSLPSSPPATPPLPLVVPPPSPLPWLVSPVSSLLFCKLYTHDVSFFGQ